MAGLKEKRSQKIIDHREKHGPFISRDQLKSVKGIGEKVFEQCVGFLRVGPISPDQSTQFYAQKNTNRLDCTYIHPESYSVAAKIIAKLNLNTSQIGQDAFIKSIKSKSSELNMNELALNLKSSVETVKQILDTLIKPLNFDLRYETPKKPLFKKGLNSMRDLKAHVIVTGSVTNVTHFGCFVDIGVESNGLIHTSRMRGYDFQIGDRVEVKVVSVEVARKRIQLEAISKVC